MVGLHDISWHSIHLPRRAYTFYWHILQYPIFFVIGWGTIAWRRWRKRTLEETAQSWPIVQARVWSSLVANVPHTSRYMATVTYSYFVDEYRTGKYMHEFRRKEEAEDFIRDLRDKVVNIRYNQNNPNISVLEQSMVEQIVALAPVRG